MTYDFSMAQTELIRIAVQRMLELPLGPRDRDDYENIKYLMELNRPRKRSKDEYIRVGK